MVTSTTACFSQKKTQSGGKGERGERQAYLAANTHDRRSIREPQALPHTGISAPEERNIMVPVVSISTKVTVVLVHDFDLFAPVFFVIVDFRECDVLTVCSAMVIQRISGCCYGEPLGFTLSVPGTVSLAHDA